MSDITLNGSSVERATRTPRPLLVAGSLAGPLYVGIGTVEALARDGFDITRHSLSLLANGPGGWVHSAMLVGTGLLTVLGALGLARSMPSDHRSAWAPRGVGLFGLGVAVAGLLRADPAEGFPMGTPDGPPETVTWHGIGHLVAGGVGFLGLILACLVLARWFHRRHRSGWARFSLVTGVYYLVSFAGIASGAGSAAVNIAFTVAVVLGWLWVTVLLGRAGRDGGLR
ncbi:MAG TPA: DUF998 domain-containing protein [Actinomycetales bacterium]|nr:DUF998 domain-containing protein [Actinomycetales bacterium]